MRPVITSTLKNGFRVYSQYDSASPANLCGICVRVGSTSDPPPFYGLAHLLEHVIFRKTKKRSLRDVLLTAQRLGGVDDSYNVHTSGMHTFYGTGQLSRRRLLKESFELIADLLRNFKVDRAGLKTEKAAIYQENFLVGQNLADAEVTDLLLENLYTKNPIRNRTIGWPHTVKPVPPSRLTNFYRKYYTAGNMAAIIFGPKHQESVELAKQYFGDLPEVRPIYRFGHYNITDDFYPVLGTMKTVIQEWPRLNQSHLAFGFPMPADAKHQTAFELLAMILGFCFWMELRENNQDFNSGAYRAFANFENSEIHSVLVFQTAVSPGQEDRVTEIMANELKKLRASPCADDLFEASVSGLLRRYFDAFGQSGGALCDLVTDAFENGDEELKKLEHYPKELRNLTPRKLMALANQYIDPQNCVRAIIKPA